MMNVVDDERVVQRSLVLQRRVRVDSAAPKRAKSHKQQRHFNDWSPFTPTKHVCLLLTDAFWVNIQSS